MAAPRFSTGNRRRDTGALRAFQQTGESTFDLLFRHASGHWRELDEEDRRENEFSVVHGFRLLSAYPVTSGEWIWIITEADRSVTTPPAPRRLLTGPRSLFAGPVPFLLLPAGQFGAASWSSQYRSGEGETDPDGRSRSIT